MALNLKTRNVSSILPPDQSPIVAVDLTGDDDDTPVDLSCRREPDKEEDTDNPCENITTQEELNKYIKTLQAELRNEEANLILLQKLRLSQQKDQKLNGSVQGQHPSQYPAAVEQALGKHQSTKIQNGAVSNKKGALNQSQHQQKYGALANTKTGNVSQHSSHASSRTTSSSVVTSATRYHQQSSAYQVNGGGTPQQSAQLQLQEQQRKLIQQEQQAAIALFEQNAARRLAAAKLMVQKNLERELLQTPGPRSNPYDTSFVPNPTCLQFLSLLGLEQAVERLISTETASKTDSSDTSEIQEPQKPTLVSGAPRCCCKCSTDFTPKWTEKVDRSKAKTFWCEACFRSEKKRLALKHQEERLNSAFTKAAQQDQEVEKTIAAELKQTKQQIDAMILPVSSSSSSTTSFRTAPARNSPVPGPSPQGASSSSRQSSSNHHTNSSPASAAAAQQFLQQKQQILQKQLQQKPARQQQSVSKSLLSSVFQQPPLDLERLMMYNEKMDMFKQMANRSDQSSSLLSSTPKDRTSVRQNVRHTPYGRP